MTVGRGLASSRAVEPHEASRLRVLTGVLLTTVAIGSFVSTSTSVLMPLMAAELGGRSLYALPFGLCMLAELVALVVGARICDTTGPVRALLYGAALHVLGLLTIGSASGFGWLLAGRTLQGAGTGLATVAVYVLVTERYSERQRAGMFGLMASARVVPALLGPVLGGLVARSVDWRVTYFFVSVIELVALVVVWPTLRALDRDSVRRVAAEAIGFRLLTAVVLALGLVVIMCFGYLPDALKWPALVCALVTVAVGARSLLPTSAIRKRPGLSTGIKLRALIGGFYAGAAYLLPLALVEGRGYSVITAGLALSCGAVGFTIGGLSHSWQRVLWMPIAKRGAASLLLLAVGMAATAAGLAPHLPAALVYVGWGIGGLGVGMGITAFNLFVLGEAPATDRGTVSAAMRITDAVGSTVLVAAGGLVLAVFDASDHSAADAAEFLIGLFAAGTLAAVLLVRRLENASHLTQGGSR